MDNLLVIEFEQFDQELIEVEGSLRKRHTDSYSKFVDLELFNDWGARVLGFFRRAFGEKSYYFETFKEQAYQVDNHMGTASYFSLCKGTFRAAKREAETRSFEDSLAIDIPSNIRASLARFRADHPDPRTTAFVMMQFGASATHAALLTSIRTSLDAVGITAIRADDKFYHDDLFPNVLTYLYGCGMCIAVFDSVATEVFNPNVSVELGYALALNKPVMLLKDKALKTMPADLMGRLYREFDRYALSESAGTAVRRWVLDRGLSMSARE